MESIDNLHALPRKELQALAKEHGLKANKKTVELIQELTSLWQQKQAAEAVVEEKQGSKDSDIHFAYAIGNSEECTAGSACPRRASGSRTMPVGSANKSASKNRSDESIIDLAVDAMLSTGGGRDSSFAVSPIQRNSTRSAGKKSAINSPFAIAAQQAADMEADMDIQDMDDSTTSLQERSFRNLTMNIDQFGRVSLSSPLPCLQSRSTRSSGGKRTTERVSVATVTGNTKPGRDSVKEPTAPALRKVEVRTPAKAHPAVALVPKSNKTQRLRQEALEKKKERLNNLVLKDKKISRPMVNLKVARESVRPTWGAVTKKAEPTKPTAPAPAVMNKHTTPLKSSRSSIFSSAAKKTPTTTQYFMVDNEVSFNMGSSAKPPSVKLPVGVSAAAARSKGRRVPDFKKMHSAQFSAQKSIAHKVSRDVSLSKKLDKAMSEAFGESLAQQNKENDAIASTNTKSTSGPSTKLKNKEEILVKPAELRQHKFLQSAKAKREAMQTRRRIEA